jgi:rhodanese-related sulfurtransferase
MHVVLLWALGIVSAVLLSRTLRALQARRRVPALKAAGATIVDVRTAEEFANDHLPGSINAPLAQLPDGLDEVDRGKPVIVCCASGVRSEAAVTRLRRVGFIDVVNGGSWRDLR